MKLGPRGVARVEKVNRVDLKKKTHYSNMLLVNRTANPLSWFMECKDRNNQSAITLLFSFLPTMAAKKLRHAAEQVRLAYSSNYSQILDTQTENNNELFMIERLILMGAKTFIRTYKEDEKDLSLTDDLKKNTKIWLYQFIPWMKSEDQTCKAFKAPFGWRERHLIHRNLTLLGMIRECQIPKSLFGMVRNLKI